MTHATHLLLLSLLNSISTYFDLILQDAWEDVDPDELSYEVNLKNIKVCVVYSLSASVSCFKNML